MNITITGDYNITLIDANYMDDSYKVANVKQTNNKTIFDVLYSMPIQDIEIINDDGDFLGNVNVDISAKLSISINSDDLIYYIYNLGEERDLTDASIEINQININDFKTTDNVDYKDAYNYIINSMTQYFTKNNADLKITLYV